MKTQYIDVKWIQTALDKLAPAVCLIKVAQLGISATGFLIGRDLVITNYHVLSSSAGNSLLPPDVLNSVQLSFGSAPAPNASRTFALAQNAVVWSSPIEELDCLLLRVSEDVTAAAAIQPIVADSGAMLEQGAGLLIFQHPQGESLKLFTSPNSVTEVKSNGLVRYLSLADHGSSGAPCFDDDQRLVAIHHAERSTPFGSVREGILFRSVYPQIQNYL